MKSNFILLLTLAAGSSSAMAYTINFVNRCNQPIWAAVGAAPNGAPNPSIAFGAKLPANGGTAQYGVADGALGVRSWARTGCNGDGANCATGACNGGMRCTDAGITSNVLLAEYGYGSGNRIYWDLSHAAGERINVGARLSHSDGQSVQCTASSCADNQAFSYPTDYGATRNSPVAGTFTHTFCP